MFKIRGTSFSKEPPHSQQGNMMMLNVYMLPIQQFFLCGGHFEYIIIIVVRVFSLCG